VCPLRSRNRTDSITSFVPVSVPNVYSLPGNDVFSRLGKNEIVLE
jgi:hypothetical protein